MQRQLLSSDPPADSRRSRFSAPWSDDNDDEFSSDEPRRTKILGSVAIIAVLGAIIGIYFAVRPSESTPVNDPDEVDVCSDSWKFLLVMNTTIFTGLSPPDSPRATLHPDAVLIDTHHGLLAVDHWVAAIMKLKETAKRENCPFEFELDAWDGGIHGNDTILPHGRIINMHQKGLVTPGMIDGHIHLLSGGLELSGIQLRESTSKDDFILRIANWMANSTTEWTTGGRWDETRWPGAPLPQRDWLDPVTDERPVFLSRLDGHMGIANTEALKRAGLFTNTSLPDVPGIDVDEFGWPTGILRETAQSLVSSLVPLPTREQYAAAYEAAVKHLWAHGIVSVSHVGSMHQMTEGFLPLFDDGKLLPLWIDVEPTLFFPLAPMLHEWSELAKLILDRDLSATHLLAPYLGVGNLKGFMDGSLGARGAWFLEPYLDTNGSGWNVSDVDQIRADAIAADAAGLRICIHAIGDRGVREVLDIFQAVNDSVARHPQRRRWRIEHSQHIDPDDDQRYVDLNVIASMQPRHLVSDAVWADSALGVERSEATSYKAKTLTELGVSLAFGSDWPVEPVDISEGLYAAVTRKSATGQPWVEKEKIAVEQALWAYTAGPAQTMPELKYPGKLDVGVENADTFVLWEENLLDLNPDELWGQKVKMTVVRGEIVFDKQLN